MKVGMIVRHGDDYYKVVRILSEKRGNFKRIAHIDKSREPFIISVYGKNSVVHHDIMFDLFAIPFNRAL